MKTLIPNRLLFRFEFPLRYRAKPPTIDGRLRDWSDEELLPSFGEMDGENIFAPIWCCWNEAGLYIATRVTDKKSPLKCDPQAFWKGDNLRLMLDTRDTRNTKRASRFCHHLFFLPCGGPDDGAVATSAPINRAKENAPPVSIGRISLASVVSENSYQMEGHIPSECLNGFDPSQHRRIGFYTMLEDRDHGQQSLTIGDELPWHINPSLWATALLEK